MLQASVKKGKVFTEEVPAPQVSEGYILIKVVKSCISTGTEMHGIMRSKRSLVQKAIEKPDKLLDYDDIEAPKRKPNRVKLGIEEGESRFPPEAVAPNKKKYNEKGEYVKHKDVVKKKKEHSEPSMGKVMREAALSNPYRKKKGRA